MSIVSRYLLAGFVAASTAVFLGLLAMTLGADALLRLDRLGSEPQSVAFDLVLRALELVPLGVPIACVVGATWSLTRAVRSREITAIRSGGIPLRGALLPLVGACLVLAGCLIWVEDRVLVPARERVSEAAAQAERGGVRRPRWSNGRWWYAGADSVISARSWSEADAALLDVTIFELDPEHRIRRRIDAREARFVSDSTWQIADARVLDFGDAGLERQTLHELVADLHVGKGEFAGAEPELESTSLHQLARGARRADDPRERAAFGVAFHARLAQPWSVVCLVLFAICFAVGDTGRGDSLARALLAALGVVAAFWVVWTLALLGGRTGAVPPAIPIWSVVALFLAAGLWRFRRIEE